MAERLLVNMQKYMLKVMLTLKLKLKVEMMPVQT